MRQNAKDTLSTKELTSLPIAKPGGGKNIKLKKVKAPKKGKTDESLYGAGGYGSATSTK